jgi:hypothetical protein
MAGSSGEANSSGEAGSSGGGGSSEREAIHSRKVVKSGRLFVTTTGMPSTSVTSRIFSSAWSRAVRSSSWRLETLTDSPPRK